MDKRIFSLGMVALGLFSASARADLDVSLVGAGSYAMPVFSPSQGSVTGQLGIGYGLLLDWPMTKGFKLQFGISSLPRQYQVTSALTSATTTTQFSSWHLPLNFKFQMAPAFYLGLGGYYEQGDSSGSQNWRTLGLASRGFGAMLSAVYDYPIMPGIGWILDVRYLLGLSDMDPGATSTLKFSDAVGFTGIRMGFGR